MSHARRKVDGGRETLMAKPAGSLAIMSDEVKPCGEWATQDIVLHVCIVRNIFALVNIMK